MVGIYHNIFDKKMKAKIHALQNTTIYFHYKMLPSENISCQTAGSVRQTEKIKNVTLTPV